MKPIAVFYHCVFVLGDPMRDLPSAIPIVCEQMSLFESSGLAAAATEIICGINGGPESQPIADALLPSSRRTKKLYHGCQCRNELRTIRALEKWVKDNPDWNVLYFHSKGATHAPGSEYGENMSRPWREGMMTDLVANWRQCVADLETHDIVCSHWMWNCADGTQHIPAGNFLWITSNFAAKLPSMYLRAALKERGIDALESRYEAEVFWGNGPRPVVKQYRPNGGGGVP